jgi:hypothetical protein
MLLTRGVELGQISDDLEELANDVKMGWFQIFLLGDGRIFQGGPMWWLWRWTWGD